MMEPDDDDVSHSGFDNDYDEFGETVFYHEDDDEAVMEDHLPSLLEPHHQNNNHKRVGGAAVCGGVTGALLSVPLVAIDVTVLAVAGPAIAVAAAGGAAVVAAKTCGETKECEEEDEHPHLFPWFHHHHHQQQQHSKKHEPSTESSSEEEESKEDLAEQHSAKLPGVGLKGGGLMWIMSQKKQMEEELEVSKALKEMDLDLNLKQMDRELKSTTPRASNEVNFFKELTRDHTGPLGWLAQRQQHHHEVAKLEEGHSIDSTEFESDDEDSYYEEEEIIFDESCYATLFSDGLVEQQANLTV